MKTSYAVNEILRRVITNNSPEDTVLLRVASTDSCTAACQE